jgi:thiol-disulfide isomerase/thioredoxin
LEPVELSDRLKRIKMEDLEGRSFTLEDLGGRPVFLNFWATWCRPCVSEMASIEELYQQFKEDVVFLAITTESAEEIEAFRQKHPLTFDFARLEVEYIDAFVIELPTTLLIDANGQLRHEEEGATIWTLENNVQRVRNLLR